MLLIKAWLSLEKLFPNATLEKKMGNDQKPRCSSCINHTKTWLLLLHDYDSPQLKNIAIPAIAFSLHNFKF